MPDEINIPQIEVEKPVFQDPKVMKEVSNKPKQTNPGGSKFKINIKLNKKVMIGAGAFLFVLLITLVVPGLLSYKKALALSDSVNRLVEVSGSQDLVAIKDEFPKTKKSLDSFRNTFKLLGWTRIIPYFGGYTKDINHALAAGEAGIDAGSIVLTTIEPYGDILGLSASGDSSPSDGAKTTEERIDFLVNTIPDLVPKIDEISSKMKVVQDELTQVNSDRYPEKFKGMPLRSKIKSAQNQVEQVANFLINGKPFLESAPYLLGMDSPREYLVLFQNDKELRPTGGFMTAYAIMDVDKAKFEPVSSDDIYHLDAIYEPSIPAPDPIVKYLKGPYILSPNLRLRDMNWSPDFPTSMKMFTEAASETGIKSVDGIIAVDTDLLVNLLDVIGPIGVPGFGNFSTEIVPECNCPQVIYELESFADVEGPIVWDPVSGEIVYKPPNSDNRKRIIGPLMNSILANAMGQPKEKLGALFEAGFKSINEKHVLLYIQDKGVQKAVEDFGIGGKIVDSAGDDYLQINDANLGGRKSNLYVTQEVSQEINVAKDGSVEKTLTITYNNPEKYDGWLNSVLPNWLRVYVPQGSTLIAVEGLEDKSEPYDDLGKTVFAGYFSLRPEGVSKVTVKYKLPMKFNEDYSLYVQKQPGKATPLYTINLGKYEEEFFLKSDQTIKIGI
ncbi:DUF4012 domain-containing protein [Patescibacteria group bacterium]